MTFSQYFAIVIRFCNGLDHIELLCFTIERRHSTAVRSTDRRPNVSGDVDRSPRWINWKHVIFVDRRNIRSEDAITCCCHSTNCSLNFHKLHFELNFEFDFFSFQISLFLIVYAQDVNYLYISRLISGYVAGACSVCVPIFVIEISFDRIRGTLATVFLIAANVGTLIEYTLALYFTAVQQAIILMIFPTLFIAFFSLVPETPAYLQKINRNDVRKHEFFFLVILNENEYFSFSWR